MDKTKQTRKSYVAPKVTKLGEVKELTQTFVPAPSGPVTWTND